MKLSFSGKLFALFCLKVKTSLCLKPKPSSGARRYLLVVMRSVNGLPGPRDGNRLMSFVSKAAKKLPKMKRY